MSRRQTISERATPVMQALTAGGAELGVPVWHLTMDGDVHLGPPAGLAVGQWPRASACARHVSAGVRPASRPARGPFEIQPGCWCLPVPIAQGTRPGGLTV